jgi:pyruvate,water dikinase
MFKGKAGSLQFLKSLNLNVPEFTVICHNDFVSWGNLELYQELLAAIDSADKDQIRNKANAFVSTITIPRLSQKSDTYYAVRSSALMEDSPEHSFAGIFETKLFIAEDLNTAIKEVWLSLFQLKSLQYCLDRKLSWSNLRMDIVIQEMIDGDKSGVLFQADPMGKITEEIIVAGFGLGQGIVDEETDTDRFILENSEIKESHISEKKTFLHYKNKSIQKAAVADNKRNIPVLSALEIEKLQKASAVLSTHSEHFLDVEFTFKNSELFILQARPITTLPSKREIHIFDNSNIAENYPGFSTPLTYSALARGYTTNFKNLLRFIGAKDKDWAYLNNHLNQMIGYWGGQIYYNLNNWYAVYTILPFGAKKATASFNEMVGINSELIIKIPERSLFYKLQLLFRMLPAFFKFYIKTASYHQKYKKEFKAFYQTSLKSADEVKSAFEIIRLFDQMENEYFSMIKIPLFNDFSSSLFNRSCRMLAKKLIPKNGEQLYNDLLSNREDLESSKAIYSLIELSEMIRHDSELTIYLNSSSEPTPRFKTFFDKLRHHFDRFGDRSQWEMKLEVPTARENPESTIKLIKEYAQASMSRELQREHEKEKSHKARSEFRKQVFSKPLTSFLFWLAFNKCTEALAFREDSRFDRVRIKGLSRKLFLKLGHVLAEKKWISKNEDIFYLTYEELLSLVHDSYGPEYWRELIELRQKHLDKFKGLRLPDRILTNDLISAKKFSLTADINFHDSMKGIPCSGGLVETECVVVTDLNHAPSLTGKILVAERTDPAWGYFFVGVKGIIIEKGSMLSHAAIISRELGIPCIINVKNATQALKTGMKIKMNGDTGEIEVVTKI